jgi:hypothetical protein
MVRWVWSLPGFRVGNFLGIPTSTWIVLTIAVPIVHQVYVWATWRLELHHKTLSKLFGERAFQVYAPAFIILLIARAAVLVPLAIANQDTFQLDRRALTALTILCTLLPAWVLVSIARYFSFRRAMGADHFDESYRNTPLVRKGVFHRIPNAMYTLGFLIAWVPAWLFASKAALLAAGFAHAYIWVHYFTLERPDMKTIYGSHFPS